MNTVTHLNFRGQARDALTFYQSVFGGDLQLVTYAQSGQAAAAARPDDVIWGQVTSAEGFSVMAYDVQAAKPWNPGVNAFYLSVRSASEEEIRGHWDKLVVGGEIVQPLAPSMWASLYGMTKDRFGITWVLDVAAPVG